MRTTPPGAPGVTERVARRVPAALRRAVLAVAVVGTVASDAALLGGVPGRDVLPLAVLPPLAVGLVLWDALPERRWVAVAVPTLLLGAVAAGAARGAAHGLRMSAGLSHAIAYTLLLLAFAASLRRGHTPVITRLARAMNPHFTAGMAGYTRAVTVAWSGFFAAQLAVSALLLSVGPPGWWILFVTTLHAPLVLAMAVAEYAVRRRVLRGQRHSRPRDMLRAFIAARTGRPLAAAQAVPARTGEDASTTAAGCREDS